MYAQFREMPLAKEFHCVYECRANVRPLLFPHHLAQPSVHTSTTRSSLLFLLHWTVISFILTNPLPLHFAHPSTCLLGTPTEFWTKAQARSEELGAAVAGVLVEACPEPGG